MFVCSPWADVFMESSDFKLPESTRTHVNARLFLLRGPCRTPPCLPAAIFRRVEGNWLPTITAGNQLVQQLLSSVIWKACQYCNCLRTKLPQQEVTGIFLFYILLCNACFWTCVMCWVSLLNFYVAFQQMQTKNNEHRGDVTKYEFGCKLLECVTLLRYVYYTTIYSYVFFVRKIKDCKPWVSW